MPLETIILLIILLVVLFGVLPTWPYSRSWGPFPAGAVGLLLVILLLLFFVRA